MSRSWCDGDTVELDLPMPVERVSASPLVNADVGQVAIQRGPLVYCLESCDQKATLADLYLPADVDLKAEKREKLLGGVMVVTGSASIAGAQEWRGKLYQQLARAHSVPFVAVPYYAWDNRTPGPMQVWLPTGPHVPASQAE